MCLVELYKNVAALTSLTQTTTPPSLLPCQRPHVLWSLLPPRPVLSQPPHLPLGALGVFVLEAASGDGWCFHSKISFLR